MRLHRSLIAALAAAGALSVGLLLAPASQAAAQDAKAPMITVSGTALNPDGSPGANLPVALKAPEKKPVGGDNPPGGLAQDPGKDSGKAKAQGAMKVLAKGTTDAQGKFSLKFQPSSSGEQGLMLEVGDNTKTPWAKQPVVVKGKDVDLGNIQLKAPVSN